MHTEYGKTTVAALVIAAGLLLLDLLAPGTARFGGPAFLSAVVIPALIAPEEV